MQCRKCHGLMAVDSFIDLLDDSGQLWISAWRCLNCGQLVDPGTIKNIRRISTTVVTGSARRTRRRRSLPYLLPRLTI